MIQLGLILHENAKTLPYLHPPDSRVVEDVGEDAGAHDGVPSQSACVVGRGRAAGWGLLGRRRVTRALYR